jgi:hypothetical protein
MQYTKQAYDMAVSANSHTGLKKPSYKEREKLLARYHRNSMNRVKRITADLVKEVMTGESI